MARIRSTPTVTRTPAGRLLFSSEDRNLAANLAALVRYAVESAPSAESCAARLGVSMQKLRQLARAAGVPLEFGAGKPASASSTPVPSRSAATAPATRPRSSTFASSVSRPVAQKGGRR
ncbi:hypothetical protein SAMN02745121_03320 [Nannocystis exedens]|uniref:Uncharacterized protein n=1 Tax=Nannocystis exedens TaxID=54 RepID=A0A1I1YJL3_9BACT|nr:hypothetical protein NAEX_03394 [Nannocystis exedens]SFE19218.1 hypothetical protein SAMN02745121_03320 [Nannocystis exedens]